MKSLFDKICYYLISKNVMFLKLLPLVLMLTGCEDEDTSSGEEGNFNGQASCWQTNITNSVTRILNDLFLKGNETVVSGKAGVSLILIGFSVWIALKLLKMVGSFKEENIGEVLTEITQKLFVCAFCAYFVTSMGNTNQAIKNFLAPVYTTMLELGAESLGDEKVTLLDLGIFGSITYTHENGACPAEFAMESGNNLRGVIQPISNCMICRINSRLNAGIRISLNLISSGSIGTLLLGLFLLIVFWASKIGFVLYTIDGLFRLNFAAYLFTLLIVGIPFDYTRKWSKHGFLMFLNSAGVMMFMGILVGIAIGGMEAIINALSGDFTEEGIVGFGKPLLSLFLIGLLFFNIPGLAVALSDKLVGGGGGLEFQKKITEFIVMMAKKAGASVINSISDGVTSSFTQALEKHETLKEIADNVKQTANKASSALNSLAGYNKDD